MRRLYRKDFRAIAFSLNATLLEVARTAGPGAGIVVYDAAIDLANKLQNSNPLFDRERFMDAVFTGTDLRPVARR